MKKKEMFFAINDECFLTTDLKGTLQKLVDKYNASQNAEYYEIRGAAHEVSLWCNGLYMPYEFGGDLSVLLFAIEGRRGKKLAWGASAHSAFDGGELEICRELVFREMLEYSNCDRNFSRWI